MNKLDEINLRNFQAVWSLVNKKAGKEVDFKEGFKWYRAVRHYETIRIYKNMLRLLKERKKVRLNELVNSLESERIAVIYSPTKKEM